jgi:hypothetical protein
MQPRALPSSINRPTLRDGVMHNGKEINGVKILMEKQEEMIKNQQVKIELIVDTLEKQTKLLQTLVSATHVQKTAFDADNLLSSLTHRAFTYFV